MLLKQAPDKHVGIATLTERRSAGLKVTFYTGVIIIHSNDSSQPLHVNLQFYGKIEMCSSSSSSSNSSGIRGVMNYLPK